MAVYLRGKIWYLRLKINGRRYHKSIQEATCKKDAEKAEAIFKSELLQGRYNLANNKGSMLFSKLIDVYNDYAKTNKLAWKKEECRVKSLLAFFGDKSLKEITPITIEKYRSTRKKHTKKNGDLLSNASINRETSILRKMFNIAVENDWIDTNPCLSRKVKPLREESKRERYLETNEEERLIDLCNRQYIKPIIICALHTGMRKGEILNLEWCNVDFKNNYISVRKTKSGKNRNIPISSSLKKELLKLYNNKISDYVFTNPETNTKYRDIKKSFNSLLNKANIENFVFHDLRHTAATRMVSSGIDLIVVQEILGHASITTTMRYSHPVPERKANAIEKLDTFMKANKNNNNIIALHD